MPRSNKKKCWPNPPPKSPSVQLSSSSSEHVLMKQEQNLMIARAISSAKKHAIDIQHGTPNSANGNCAIESVIFNVNDRQCFPESLPFTPDYYRRIWMTDFMNQTVDDQTWNIYSKKQWEEGWKEMMESGVYERGLFGDLLLVCYCLWDKKDSPET